MSLPKEKLELGLKVCEGIALGKSVKVSSEGFNIPEGTFFGWLTQSKVLAEEYTRVRQSRADARYESIDEVIREMREGVIDPNIARIQIDTIKWQCGKEKGKVYGDATQLRHADANGDVLSVSAVLAGLDEPDAQ